MNADAQRARTPSPTTTSCCFAWPSSCATTSRTSSGGASLDQRVVDDDPPGRADAGHVGVQRRRTRDSRRPPARRFTGTPSSRASWSRDVRSGPSGIGVNLLKTGSTTTG